MNVRVRRRPSEPPGSSTDVLLDWFREPRSRTVSIAGEFAGAAELAGLPGDLFRFVGSAYCADRVITRAAASDRWTRDIRLEIGVEETPLWRDVADQLQRVLSFLTGDRWQLRFRRTARQAGGGLALPEVDAVCLFSGGLDSLCGAIDLLEAGARVLLIGHYEAGQAPGAQRSLASGLSSQYGPDRAVLYQLHLAPAPSDPRQERPLPVHRENTTRGRSLLFIGVAVAVAELLGEGTPVHVPENGFIGINVPLRRRRGGSHSTRTTHPWFMTRLADALQRLGVAHPIINPYRLKTKGEAVAEVGNAPLLARLIPASISCAHPEWPRYRRRQQGNCGFCFPCLIRRSALHACGLDYPADYAFDALTEGLFLDPQRDSGAHLRAVLASLREREAPLDVIRNGPVPELERGAFHDVYRRGRAELRKWIEEKGSGDVKRLLAAA